MRERRTKVRASVWLLTALLAATMLVDGALGLGLQARAREYSDKPLLAVPLLWLRDKGRESQPRPKGDGPVPAETAPRNQDHDPTNLVETTVPTEAPAETTVPEATVPVTTAPETTAPLAVYGRDEHYFDDALFIGDSRLEASARYARLGNADYFTGVGMTVFQLFSQQCYDDNFSTTDLETLLTERTYGKIYLMLGINEAGYALDSLEDAYARDLAKIRQLQPGAKIFLLKIYGVSREQAEASGWLAPENLDRINDGIESLCDGKTVVCLDPREIYEDGEGYLREDCSDDGVHPYVKDLGAFNEWLCENAQ